MVREVSALIALLCARAAGELFKMTWDCSWEKQLQQSSLRRRLCVMAVDLLLFYWEKNRSNPPEISTATRTDCLQEKCNPGATTCVVTSQLHPPHSHGGCERQRLAGPADGWKPSCLWSLVPERYGCRRDKSPLGTLHHGYYHHTMEKDQVFQVPITAPRPSQLLWRVLPTMPLNTKSLTQPLLCPEREDVLDLREAQRSLLHFGSIQSVTQGRLSEVPKGPGFTVSEIEVTVFLTYSAKCL